MKNKRFNLSVLQKRIISAVAFLLAAIVLAVSLSDTLHMKEKAPKMVDFFDAKNETYDVVAIGTSRIFSTVMPHYMWQKYGQAVGNMSQSRQSVAASYYLAKYAIRTQTPDVIIFDVAAVRYESQTMWEGKYSYLHESIDRMGFNRERYEAITELLPMKDWAEFFFPFMLYHSRWDEVEALDFKDPISYNNGAEAYMSLEVSAGPPITTETIELEATAEKYYRMLIELCQANNVNLILINAPIAQEDEDAYPFQKAVNRANQIAGEYGLSIIDYNTFAQQQLGFNYATDLTNPTHCNNYGAIKITNHLADYINQNFPVPDRRGEKKYNGWDEKFALYDTIISLRDITDVNEYFKRIKHENFIVVLYGKGNISNLLNDVNIKNSWFYTLGMKKDISAHPYHSYIAILDGGKIIYELLQNGPDVQVFDRYVGDIPVHCTSDPNDAATGIICEVNGNRGLGRFGLNILVYDKTRLQVVDKSYISATDYTKISHP